MIPLRRLFFLLAAVVGTALGAFAQISYTGGDYFQNFNGLPSSGTFTFSGVGPHALPGSAISGWSFAKINGSGTNALFAVGTGSSTTGSVYSFGAAASAERAIGTLLSGTVGSAIGVTLTNGTGSTLTQFTVSYAGEQWRYGGTTGTDRLTFEYRVGGTDIVTGTFVPVAALDFASRVNGTTLGTAGPLVGNDPANKAVLTSSVTGIAWLPGQTLVLRWTDFNVTGSDDGLAVDDFTFGTGASPVASAPTVASVIPADAATGVSPGAAIGVTFGGPTAVTGTWYTIAGSASGAHPATVSGGATTYVLTPTTPFAEGETVTVTLLAAGIKDGATSTLPLAADYGFAFTTQTLAPLPVHAVQGSGTTSPYVGQIVSVEGVVTATFQVSPGLSGFYLQTPDASVDANPATSQGMFVFNTTYAVNVGDFVRVAGTVAEFGTAPRTQTEMTNVTFVGVSSAGNAVPAPVAVTLPFASATDAERYEGMLVTLPQALTVTDNFDLGQFGEVFLSNGRLNTPTNVVSPGAPAIQLAAANALNLLMLDDANGTPFPDPTPFLEDSAGRGETRRSGSTATGVTGILDEKFGSYVVEPTVPVTFVDANPRRDPPAVAGTLKVAIGNVLNLFNGNGSGGGFPTSRGADTLFEYQRQRAKIVAAIVKLAPDIMGLTEVENDGYGSLSAIADLVGGLNAAAPGGTSFAFVDASAVDIVSDAIHCAFIYRVQTVAPVGAPAMLSHSSFNGYARNPLAQTFQQLSNGEKLTISINHFKSKGSASSGAGATNGIVPNPNLDQGDGQAQSNYIRVLQAKALAAWLATDPTGSGDPDFLILGDLNAYAKEDPIVALESAGYINLTEASEGVGGYSYAFNAQFGHLDHALANGPLAAQVLEAATWHANSDEPVYYDYNTENKNASQQAINVGTPYRYSDHDPVVVGLELMPSPAADVTSSLAISRSGLRLNRATGRYLQTITIKNTGTELYVKPVSAVFAQLSSNATVYAPTGYTSSVAPVGNPFVDVYLGGDTTLAIGETTTLVVEFVNPTNKAISYTLKLLAGPGTR